MPHCRALQRLGHQTLEIRTLAELQRVDGLVLPGGESTTQLRLLRRGSLDAALDKAIGTGMPVLATCAGVILAAKRVHDPDQESFGWLNVTVRRNAYGRQLDSFETTSSGGFPCIFIRAPRIVELGDGVEVLDQVGDEPILVKEKTFVGACFHPELTDSLAVHDLAFGAG